MLNLTGQWIANLFYGDHEKIDTNNFIPLPLLLLLHTSDQRPKVRVKCVTRADAVDGRDPTQHFLRLFDLTVAEEPAGGFGDLSSRWEE